MSQDRPDVHNDKSQWQLDSKGKPKDPLGWQYELPLISVDDGRVVNFRASTVLTRAAVGRLLDDFAATARRPFVTLMTSPNPDIENQTMPDIVITGHSDDDSDVAMPKPASARPAAMSADLDDEIPY